MLHPRASSITRSTRFSYCKTHAPGRVADAQQQHARAGERAVRPFQNGALVGVCNVVQHVENDDAVGSAEIHSAHISGVELGAAQ